MELDLTGKTALVTGGGRGNGRAIALELAENGADVVVNDLEEEVAKDTAEAIRVKGCDAPSGSTGRS